MASNTGPTVGLAEGVHAARRAKLNRRVRARKLDALLISDSVNVRYLSGFTGGDSWLLLQPEVCTLITDGRFAEQAEQECAELTRVIREGGMAEEVGRVLKAARIARCGIEGGHVTVLQLQSLEKVARKCEWVSTSGLVREQREVKGPEEVELIRRAVEIAQEAWRETVARGLKGRRTEREVAGYLEWAMRRQGADEAAFETICAFDERGSLPHARAGNKRLGDGTTILFDWGARAEGYNSDLTRVVSLDRMPAQLKKIYEVVLSAQAAAIARVAPGVECREVDAAAREIISAKGYGEAFRHGTGHGVGLEIHEGPGLNTRSHQELAAGMVVTIEPGVYVPGLGGVRIEDMVLVTETGAEVLTGLPKQLKESQRFREKPPWT